MQKYFREHRWQRNARLSLMCALLVLLIIAMLPTAYFNWYSKRYLLTLKGEGFKYFNGSDFLVTYFSLASSAAQPVSPTLCYFDVSRANILHLAADSCRWGGLTPIEPPWLAFRHASRITALLLSGMRNNDTDANIAEMLRLARLPRDEADLGLWPMGLSSYHCDFDTPLSRTAAFQASVLGMASMAILSSWNAAGLFAFRSAFLRRRIRKPLSRCSRRVIKKISTRAARTFPTTGHRPDLAEGIVTTPLLALHMTIRLFLDMLTSKLAKVGQLKGHTLFGCRGRTANLLHHQVLLLIFAFVQGCIRLYPAHDPYFHIIQHEGWTFGQILAVLFPLSPLALVVNELFNGGNGAWHTSSKLPENLTPAIVITQIDNPSHDRGIELRTLNDGHSEANNRTDLNSRQTQNVNDQGEDSVEPVGATSILDSLEYRSSKWMSIAVWLLVITVTLHAASQLIYIYVGHSEPERLSLLVFVALATLPASCYAWALMGLSIWSETSHYNLGYRHGSRLIKLLTTPNASQFMMLTAFLGPLGVILLTLLEVLAYQRPSLDLPSRKWAWYLLFGCYGAITAYFTESIEINLIVLTKSRFRRQNENGNVP